MLKTIIKSFVIGSSMMIPGVSGGSMAMILGEYDHLISAVANLFSKKTFFTNFIYLLVFLVFALLGIVLVASPLEMLLDRYSTVIMYLFIGAVAGTVPMMLKKAKTEKLDFISLVYIAIGILLVLSIRFIPPGIFNPTLDNGIFSILLQILGGIIISVGLILPGISTSYLLLVFGLYESILSAINNHEFLSLLPIMLGLVGGILVLSKALDEAMKKAPKVTYTLILGFLLGSIKEIYPGLPSSYMIILALLLFVSGFLLVYFLSLAEEKREIEESTSN